MNSIILFLSISWGLTHILVSSSVLDKPRNWIIINYAFIGEMIKCYQCTSFWTGILLYIFIPFHIAEWFKIIDPILAGILSSGFCSLTFSIFSMFNRISPKKLTKKDI